MRRTDILERKDEILEWIKEDLPNAEIARRLKCKVDTLKSYYTKMGITYSGLGHLIKGFIFLSRITDIYLSNYG